MGKRGNSRSVYSTLAASNHSTVEREENDFYATPRIATEALLEKFEKYNIMQDKTSKIVWEPCCGKGHIASVLADAGYKVLATDLIVREQVGDNYVYKDSPNDMFSETSLPPCNIVTNPPYGMCNEAVEKCLSLLHPGDTLAMLLKIQFLETKKRYEIFKNDPPKYVFVFSNRIECAKGGEFNENEGRGGAACFAWYVWEKGYAGLPMIDWIVI